MHVLIAVAAVWLFLPQQARAQAVPITYKNFNTSSSPYLNCLDSNYFVNLPGGVTSSTQMSITLDTGKQTCPPVNGQTYPLSIEFNGSISIVIPPNLTGTPDPNNAGSYILSSPVTIKVQVTGTYSSTDSGGSNPNSEEIDGSLSSGQTQCTTPQGLEQTLLTGSGSLQFTQSCTVGELFSSGGQLSTGTGVVVKLTDPNGGNAHEILIDLSAFFYFTATAASTPHISVSPTSLSFGNVTVGENATLPLNVSNTGSAPLTVSAITSSDPAYTVTAPSIPFTVAANGSTPATVQFAPPDYETYDATLTIASNDPSSPATSVALSGTGVCGTTASARGGARAAAASTCTPPSITITKALPNPGDLLFATAPSLPAFCAFGSYTASGQDPVQVDLVLTDSMGNEIAYSSNINLTFPAGQGQWGGGCTTGSQLVFITPTTMPSTLVIPPGSKYDTVIATFNLQAVLIDAATTKTLATSAPVPYQLAPGVDVTSSQVELSGNPLDPSYTVFVKNNGNLALSVAGSGTNSSSLGLKINYDFAGSSGLFQARIQQADANGNVVDLFESPPAFIPGEEPLTLDVSAGRIAYGATQISFIPYLTLPSGQAIAFPNPKLTFGVENVIITTASPESLDCLKAIFTLNFSNKSACPILGTANATTSNTFNFNGTAVSSKPGEGLYRIVLIVTSSAGPSLSTPTQVNVQLMPGTPVPFSDSVTIPVPANATQVVVDYVIATSQSAAAANPAYLAHDLRRYFQFISPNALSVVASNLNQIQNAAQAQLQLLGFKVPAVVNSLVSKVNDAATKLSWAGLGKNLSNMFGKPLSFEPKKKDKSNASAANQVLTGISTTWVFDTAIPHDGSFSASLSLDYSASTFPDDPNFSEATMQMMSVDPSGALHFYPTTVDTTNKVATATIDGLDQYFSLVNTGANGQTAVMLASVPTGYTLVNAGAAASNLTVAQYDANGNGTPAALSLKPGTQQGTTPNWLQAWADSPGVVGASWFNNGSLFAVTPSSAPGGAFILTDVEYGANLSTEIDLANNSTQTADVGIGLYGPDGTQVGSISTLLDSKTALSERVEGLFPSITASFTGYVVVAADQSLVASGYRFTNTTATGLAAQSLANSPTVLYAPQLGGSNVVTTLHLVNNASTTANVTLKAWSASGTAAAQNVQVQIKAGAQYTAQIPAIFGLNPSTTGSLEVDSDTAGIFGDVLVQDSSFIPSFAVSLALTAQPAASSVFPYVTSQGSASIFNPGTNAATVTVSAFGPDGSAGSSSTVSIAANGLASAAIASNSNGYVTISSNQPVVAAGFLVVPSGTTTGYLPIPATVKASSGGGLPGGPQITAGGVVNAADYVAKVSRGALAFAFGTNFASSMIVAQTLPLGLSLGGVSVTVGGVAAPVYIIGSTFVEFQVPYEVAEGSSIPVVVTVNGVASNTVDVAVADYALGVFTYPRTSTITDPDVFHLNGTLLTPTSPAVPSETVIVIANGIGKLNNPPQDGAAVGPPYPTAVDTPVVTVNGAAAVSQYAGLLAGDLGVVQMNIQLPAQLPSGTLPLVIQFPGDSSPPVNLYVAGNIAGGAPQISVAPLSFSAMVGQPQTLPLTITNMGTAPLTITNISLTPSGGPFTINYPSLPLTLQPGGSTGGLLLASVTVTFTPTSAGMASANVIISSNDPNTPSKTVGLSGTATGANMPPSIAVTPSGLNFSSVAQGSTKQVSLTVSNTGGSALNVSALTAGGVFSVVSPATPFTVAANGSSTVTLQFSPTGAGGQYSTLNIASNDPNHPNLAVPIWGTGYNPANVLTSDSFNRANATECALGTTDLKLGGTTTYQYLPTFPGSSGPVGASIVSDSLQNNGLNYGGVQLTTSTDVCNTARGSTFPQDLDVIVDVSVPGAAGAITDAGPYFRSRAAAPGDGIFNGTSSGYSVEVFSTGQVWVNQLNPYGTIAQSPALSSFDPTIVHTLEARIQGTGLQAWLDGQPVTFTLTAGGAVTTVPVSTASNAGTAGIVFTSEQNAEKAGGQSVKNLIISSVTAATAPQISVSPTSLNLGSVTVGQTATVTLNISNTGTAALNVSAIASSNAEVTIVSPAVPFTVQPNNTTPVTVKFAPTTAGAVSGTLTITSNDPAHGQITVSFSGTGVAAGGTPVIGASTTSLAFGNVAVGQLSTMTFNVLNTGTAALTVSSVAISNPVFGLMTPAIPLTVQPNSSTTVTVVFAPQSAGAQSATFTVTSNDPAHPVVGLTLTGTGTGASNNLLAYSNVVVGQNETATLTFTNTGTTPLMVTAQTTTNAAFTVPSPSTPYSIPAGQSATIVIVFSPTAYTVYNATFSLVTNGGTFTTPLSGAGVVVQ